MKQRPLKGSLDKECKRKCAGREVWWKEKLERCARERIWLQRGTLCPALAGLYERWKIKKAGI